MCPAGTQFCRRKHFCGAAPALGPAIRAFAVACVSLTMFAAPLIAGKHTSRRWGANPQAVLPRVALGCAAISGHAGGFVLHFAAMRSAVDGTKMALDDA
jgi:hypothetical protein